MSIEEIKRLSKDCEQNSALREELSAAGTQMDKIVSIANSKGYNFTLEEINAEIEKKSGELSDEELNKVVGTSGFPTTILIVVKSCTSIWHASTCITTAC